MAQPAFPPLAHVELHTSSVVPALVAEVWKLVRAFGQNAQWSAPIGLEEITSDLLPGSIEGQLGALRHVRLGNLGFVEQLEALDDDKKTMKWRVVSHPLNANPFPGSLLNYKAMLRLHEVTVENKTFFQLECNFETEPENRELMKRELKARQEANIRGLLSLMEVKQVLRAEQLAAPLQPNLVPVPPLGVSGVIPEMAPVPATYVNNGHHTASREISPRTHAVLAAISAGIPSNHMAAAPMVSSHSSLSSAGWGSSLEAAAAARGGSGVSAPEMQQMSPGQVPHVVASVHDSVNTVGSAAINKAIQQAQAQAQAHGVESQLARLNARLQQQGLSLAEVQRPRFKASTAPMADSRSTPANVSSNAQLHPPLQSLPQIPQRRSEPDALSAASRVLSL